MSSLDTARTGAPRGDRPPRTWPWAEAAFPVLLVGLGIFTIIEATDIVTPGSANTLGPQAFPYAVGGLLVVTGAVVLVSLALGRHGEAEAGEDVDPTVRTDWRTVALLAGAFLALVVLVEPLGWLLASAVLFAGAAWALGARPWWRPLVVGLLLSLVIQVVFTQWLGVYLPPGPFAGVPFLDG